jgi:hypothetical protein
MDVLPRFDRKLCDPSTGASDAISRVMKRAAILSVAILIAACGSSRDRTGPSSGSLGGQNEAPDAAAPVPEPEEPTEQEPVPPEHDAGSPTDTRDGGSSGSCVDVDLGSALPATASGTTTGKANDFHTDECPSKAAGADVAYAWTAPKAGTYQFSTIGSSYYALVNVYSSCGGSIIKQTLLDGCAGFPDYDGVECPCPKGTATNLTLKAGQRVIVVVDSNNEENGPYTLTIKNIGSEVFKCDDGIDNDGDGLTDCADPDCGNEPRCYEDSTNCSNGKDDDNDGLVDCDDPDCAPKSELTLSGALPITVTGDTTGHGNDYVIGPPKCSESSINYADDLTYRFTAPTTGKYQFSSTVDGFDYGMVLTIARPTCGAPEITCHAYDSAPTASVDLAAGEMVLVVLDPVITNTGKVIGREGGGARFTLKVSKL